MPRRAVLVDSSVWIHFLRAGDAHPTAVMLQALLNQRVVAINWLIRLEILSGTLTEAGYHALNGDLSSARNLALTEPVYELAGRLRWSLQRKGLVIPVVDSLIAASAIRYDCALLQDDRHFRLIARHTPLRLYPSG